MIINQPKPLVIQAGARYAIRELKLLGRTIRPRTTGTFVRLTIGILLTLFMILAASAHAQTFAPSPGSPFQVGLSPESSAVGDFNGDGKPDLVTANSVGNTVTVLLGNGAGRFTPAPGSPFPAGQYPISVAVGDFNGDGKPDLVTANLSSKTVTVLLGNGAGEFITAGIPFAVGSNPFSVAVGDFNGDGKLDLATANYGSNNVTVLLGDGAGGFATAPGSPFTVGSTPASIAVGDFNGDGKLDLAAANSVSNNVTVLLGNGAGGFATAPGSPFTVGSNPSSLAIGDFNGDGKLDLATSNYGGSDVTVLLGNGAGKFTSAHGSPFAVGSKPDSIAVGDFNGDGNLDMVTANYGSNNVTVLLGSGAAGFTADPSGPFAVGSQPSNVAIGDFNGDGRPDFDATSADGNVVSVLLNTTPAFTANPASVTFYGVAGQAQSETIPVNVTSTSLVDIYTAVSNQPFLTVIPTSNPAVVLLSASAASLGAGTYSGTARYSEPNDFDAVTAVTLSVADPSGALTQASSSPFSVGTEPYSVAVGDFNKDGKLDIATANRGGNVTVLLGNAEGGFKPAPGSPFAAGVGPSSVAIGDFNGDGKLDLATANSVGNDVTVLLGNGAGGFIPAPGSPFAAGVGPSSVAVGDFNGDGKLDLATANSAGKDVTVLLGDGVGGFTPDPGSPFAVGAGPQAVALGDFNGDGRLDIATANTLNGNVSVLLGNGMGGFTAAPGSPFAAGSYPTSVAVGDFNGDGKPDLATANFDSNSVTVLLGDGIGGFTSAPGSPFSAGFPYSVTVGDFNGDGKPDLVTASNVGNNITVLLGNGAGGFTAAPGTPFAAGSEPMSVVAADFNRDGKLDLATANSDGSNVTVLLGGIARTISALTTTAASTITVGTPVPLTLTVSAVNALSTPSGTVTFLDGATVLGTATQTASAYTFTISTLSPGVHNLTATYGGDVRNAKSASNTVTITVTSANEAVQEEI